MGATNTPGFGIDISAVPAGPPLHFVRISLRYRLHDFNSQNGRLCPGVLSSACNIPVVTGTMARLTVPRDRHTIRLCNREPDMSREHLTGISLLLVVTMLWGSTFVAIKGVVDTTAPSVLIFGRFLIAALIFLPWLPRRADVWWAGVKLGFWLCLAYAAQTIGLQYTSASQSAFITVLNVIMVPLLAALGGHRITPPIWISAFMAIIGVGLMTNGLSQLNIGDAWSLLCALGYAIYVLKLGEYARRFPALELTCTQLFGVVGFALIWVGVEQPAFDHLPWAILLYLGIGTTALTTWLQTMGQQHLSAAEAAIIYTLEPVWAAVFAVIILAEHLGLLSWSGAAVICIATLVSQWPALRQRTPRSNAHDTAPATQEEN